MRPWRNSRFRFFVIVAVAMAALLGILLLQDLRERLESAQVAADVRNLNSALQVEMAHRIAAGQEAGIAELAGSNPVRWLAVPMAGYLGELSAAPAEPPAGGWFFDRSRGELVYRPALSGHLTGAGTPPLLRWRVQPPRPGDRRALVGGLVVAAVAEYHWY